MKCCATHDQFFDQREKLGLHYHLRFLVACIFFFIAPLAMAAPANITIFADIEDAAHAELLDSLQTTLAPYSSDFTLQIAPITSITGGYFKTQKGASADLFITVGTQAALAMAQLYATADLRTPVLNSLIPKINHGNIVRSHSSTSGFSAIYLDQPLSRQFDLLDIAFPGHKKIGILLGTTSRMLIKDIENIMEKRNYRAYIKIITTDNALMATLDNILIESDVLFAIPDPLIFNRYTAQNLLLATYRKKIPVVGFSRAYVKAGALMAVYSLPAHIGRHLADTLRTAATKHWRLPDPQHPRYYSVTVNRQVTRSLGIPLPDEAEMQRKLQQLQDQNS